MVSVYSSSDDSGGVSLFKNSYDSVSLFIADRSDGISQFTATGKIFSNTSDSVRLGDSPDQCHQSVQ